MRVSGILLLGGILLFIASAAADGFFGSDMGLVDKLCAMGAVLGSGAIAIGLFGLMVCGIARLGRGI